MKRYLVLLAYVILAALSVQAGSILDHYYELRQTRNFRQIEEELRANRLPSPYRDTLLLQLRDQFLNADIEYASLFHERYNDPCLKELKAQDKKLLNAYHKGMSDQQIILMMAPYRVALVALQHLIAYDLQQQDYVHALLTVQQYSRAFGDDPDYLSLLHTLEAEPQEINKIALPASINIANKKQYSPIISADGRTIYYCQRNETEDVYTSQRSKTGTDEIWSKGIPVEFDSPHLNESPICISPDGNTMLVFIDGKIYRSQRTSQGWEKPTLLPKVINSCGWQGDACLSADGRAMLFAAWKPTPYELESADYYRESNYRRANIFVTMRDSLGNWSKPQDLGPTINTPSQDRSPYLHPDGRTLYFASSGHGSLGSLDVFVSRRTGDSWTDWSTPVNLGREINSIGMNWGYTITADGSRAYFVKDDKIFYCNLPQAARPDPVATISGRVLDENNQPVQVDIRWEDLTRDSAIGQASSSPQDGSYYLVVPMGRLYGYYVNDSRYYPAADHIDMRGVDTTTNIERDIHVVSYKHMIAEGTPVTLSNLFFDTNRSDIRPESYAALDRLAEVLKQSGQKVEISGHTDNVGNAQSNQTLSEARAEAVRSYLINRGCAANQLKAIGYGQTKPLVENDSDEHRQQNRRVELRFIK